MAEVGKEWWRGCVIYQIYPRSFMDSNGDGIGDLAGIHQKLDHIAALGADAVWISPFCKSPMKDFGYDVSDYRDVDPVFGTLEDFKAILNRAHELGLKVLTDQVWCHTSDQHVWFNESRQSRDNHKADWYVWSDAKPDGTPPNNWLSWFGGPAWTWDARRRQYYLHHFLSSQPVLNYWNDDVCQAIKKVADFWMEMGVDGFRLDVSNYYVCDQQLRDNPARGPNDPIPEDPPASNPNYYQLRIHSVNQPKNLEFLKEIRALVDKWPDRCLLGEAAGEGSADIAAHYTHKGDRMNMAYTFGMLGSDMTIDPVTAAVRNVERTIDDGWICWATSNHDFKRGASRIPGEVPLADKALYATTLGLSLRGSYCMYQGEELGLSQAELSFEDLQDPYDKALYPDHVGRDGGRTPMPWVSSVPQAGFSSAPKTWLPLSPLHYPLAVDAQDADPASVLNQVKAFLKWRKETPAMRLGAIELVETDKPLFTFRRSYEGQTYTCVYNASPESAKVKKEQLGAVKSMLDVSRHAALHNDSLLLEPYGYAIFSH